ncbi:MAG: hypothetical protein AAGJ51_08200 [Pseudomonadota bacterium]
MNKGSNRTGAEWNYGQSMGLLGGVIEAVSGQTFSAYLQDRMTSNQLDPSLGENPVKLGPPDPQWEKLGFGFCGRVVREGADAYLGAAGEYGWAGWAGTDLWIDPASNRAAVVATQAMPNPAEGLNYPLGTLVRSAIYSE